MKKYPFIYLISQKVDPFITPPPPQVNFIKSLIAAHILLGGTKLRKWEPVYLLFQKSVGTLLLNMKLKYNLLIKASHYDPDPNKYIIKIESYNFQPLN